MFKLNRFAAKVTAVASSLLVVGLAHATGDYDTLTAAAQYAAVIAALMVVYAAVAGKDVIISGAKTILRTLRSA